MAFTLTLIVAVCCAIAAVQGWLHLIFMYSISFLKFLNTVFLYFDAFSFVFKFQQLKKLLYWLVISLEPTLQTLFLCNCPLTISFFFVLFLYQLLV